MKDAHFSLQLQGDSGGPLSCEAGGRWYVQGEKIMVRLCRQ